jgi:hypothetical protein
MGAGTRINQRFALWFYFIYKINCVDLLCGLELEEPGASPFGFTYQED